MKKAIVVDKNYGSVTLAELDELQKKLAHCRMLEHTFLDDNYRIARTVYSDGTVITVNFDEDTFTIE